jgi:RHS repeat-associated protein
LQHLRARYLDTGVGRFISRDVWGGDYKRPLSLNRWMYIEGNPVNFIDPTGLKMICLDGEQ